MVPTYKYINDLPLSIKVSETDLYADDTSLHHAENSIESINVVLQYDLDNVIEWCQKNSMKINPNKSKYICF